MHRPWLFVPAPDARLLLVVSSGVHSSGHTALMQWSHARVRTQSVDQDQPSGTAGNAYKRLHSVWQRANLPRCSKQRTSAKPGEDTELCAPLSNQQLALKSCSASPAPLPSDEASARPFEHTSHAMERF
eukprot:7384696-Prymnesium_polylepis.3